MKLIKQTRSYMKDSVEHKITDLYLVNERGYKIAITPKFVANKRDWRDLYDMAEDE